MEIVHFMFRVSIKISIICISVHEDLILSASSSDPDEMLHKRHFQLSLHCLLVSRMKRERSTIIPWTGLLTHLCMGESFQD